eukprot:14967996-Heterocapsa_arctica.AAC.1
MKGKGKGGGAKGGAGVGKGSAAEERIEGWCRKCGKWGAQSGELLLHEQRGAGEHPRHRRRAVD